MTRHEEVAAAAVAEQERRDRDALGRPLNPDTNLPYPSASQAQLELAGTLLAGYLAGRIDTSTDDARLIRDALVEAVVRQHGRTLRACIAELRDQAGSFGVDARTLATDAAGSDGPVDTHKLASAHALAAASSTLRTVVLRGDRA